MKKMYTNNQLKKAVAQSTNFTQVALKLGMKPSSRTNLKRKAQSLDIPFEHFGFAGKSTYTEKQLRDAVASSSSFRQVVIKLGLSPKSGGNHKTLKSKVESLGISIEHFHGRGHLKGKSHDWGRRYHLDEILIRNSPYKNNSALKRRLLKEGLLQQRCYTKECPIKKPIWLGKRLAFHLEHKNGINNDNRLENLCLLCPNCHSQTDTYCGRNKK